jgi:ABC-type Fe3+ transport system permease subunit
VPFRGVIRICILGAFVTPGFVNALSWTLLAGPNAGLLNKLWMALTGASSGFINIFSMHGLVVVSLATLYPLAFLLMYNAFAMMDTDMEDAARVLGAGRLRILVTVTLPLARPALVAGFIMTFLEALILYGAPAFIGVLARIYVVTTQLWSLFEYPPQIGLAAALSLPLLLITAGLLWVQRRLIVQRSFATIQGKGGRQQRLDLGLWKWLAVGGALLVFLAMVLLVIPGMVFAVGLFAAYSSGPIILYGTLWILVLAYLTKHLPFALMSCKAALSGVHLELESAASLLGASRLRVLRDITAPLIKNGLLGGWILVFTPSLKELSASVLLYNSRTTVIPTAIMDAYLLPQREAVAALSVLLLAINAVAIIAGYRLLGGNMLRQNP